MNQVLTEVRASLIVSTECPSCGMTLQAHLFVEDQVDPMEDAMEMLGEYIRKHTEWHASAVLTV